MVTSKRDFFEDIAVAVESWTNAVTDAMTNPDADLQWTEAPEQYSQIQRAFENAGIDSAVARKLLSESLRGLAISFLTTLDGGTALAETGRLYVVDERGKRLGEGLHDDFVTYLMESGREL